ncbi:MAG TPA: hypothetical protein VKS22_10735 [Candidatus Binataceae bacterium]|nr:hypothetical protein [Candidatus Binataceae bacterium]
MSTTTDPTTRTMLALSAISYRGYNLVGDQALKRALLKRLLDQCLTQLQPTIGYWSIVWGPCDFSPTVVGFDDAMMYVAEKVNDPTTLAIVIRGTNPISTTDFFYEDSLIEVQQPWPASAGAKISTSTALGLAVLLNLSWDKAVLDKPVLLSATPSLRERLRAEPRKITFTASEGELSRARTRIADMVTAHFKTAELLTARSGAAELLTAVSGAGAQPPDGITLEAFLRARLRPGSSTNLYVTGHSKGGAQSSTLALRLAEILSDCVVYNYSFAGPTAGNKAFADYSDRILAACCHRVWNQRDVVPRTFVPSLMKEIPDVYELTAVDRVTVAAGIASSIAALSKVVYIQVAGDGTSFPSDLAPNLDMTSQIGHQHVDAYLGWADLLGQISAKTLFAPVFG